MAAETDELLNIAVEKLLSIARALTSSDGATSIDHEQGFGVESQRVVSEEPLPEAVEASIHESSHSPFAGYNGIIPGMLVTNAIQGLLFGIEYFGREEVDAISRGVFNVAEALAERSGKEEDIVMYLGQVLDYLENAHDLAGTRLHCYMLCKFAIVFQRQGRMENAKRALYSAQRIAAGRADMADFEMSVCASLINVHSKLGEEQLLHSARLTFLEICEPRLLSTSGSSWSYEFLDRASVLGGVGRTCFDIGLYSNDMERMDDGINYLTEALNSSQSSASLLLNLAECYNQHPGLRIGQHASLILLEQAVLGFQQLECTCSADLSGNWGGIGVVECERHQRLADALMSLGIVQQNQGFMEEAQRSFERGLGLVEECHDVDREAGFHLVLNLYLFLKSHMNIAFGLQRLDDIPDLNSPRYKHGFDHFREFLKKTRPGVSFHRDQMAIYARAFLNPPEDLNQGLVEQVRALQEMLQMAEKRGARIGHAFHHQNLSVQYLRIGDITSCKRHLFLALKSLQETPTTTEEALRVLQPLGWVAMEPKVQEFDRAYEIWRRVYSATEEMLENMARISEEHAFRYFEISKHACMALAKCQMFRANISQATADQLAQSALVWAERGKGRMLMSFIESSTRIDTDPSSQYFDKRRFLSEDAFALNFICNWLPASQQRKMVFVEYTFLDYEHLLTQIVVDGTLHYSSFICLHCELSEETRQEAETYLNSVQNSSEATQGSGKTVAFQQEIQNVLSAMNRYSTNRIPFNPWIPGMVVGIQKHVGEAIAKLTRNRNSLLDKELDKVAELLQALYAVLIAPIKKHLAAVYEHGRDTLVFVPHEDLGIVPFAALQYVSGGSPRYLIEDYAISVSPSIWCTRHCQYLYEKIVQSEYEMATVPVLVGKKSGYPPEYPDLNEAHREVDAVAEVIGQSTAVMVLKDDELSHALVMEALPNASWIHLTVHGEVSSEFPQGSLLFSEDASQRLTAEEIMTIAPSAWRARAVVLSACQTGLGSVAGGGIMGFARSFILAGVPSSVLSMWQAEERFCVEFMQKLYQQLASGYSLAYAMQDVIKSMMHEYKKGRRRYREFKWSVLHWACFSCLGFPSVVLPNTEERTDHTATG